MTHMSTAPAISLRGAVSSDTDDIARVWHAAWRDGHLGHVPPELYPYRTFEHFLSRVPPRIPRTTVASLADRVVGFVCVHDNELEQLFVLAEARGTVAASALLRAGEQRIAKEFDTAWLAVAAGNQRARHFYTREGWRDYGLIRYEAEIAGGTIVLDTHRYEKRVA